MKKILLIPAMVATTFMPLIGVVGCDKNEPTPKQEFKGLTVTALNATTFIIQRKKQSGDDHSYKPDIDYSLDGGKNWIKYNHENMERVTIPKGQTMLLKGNNPEGFKDPDGETSNPDRPRFCFEGGLVELSGNIMSILDNGKCTMTDIPCDDCFNSLFYAYGDTEEDHQTITNIENLSLPATTLTPGCYYSMFTNQQKLIKPMSVLPAETLADKCYYFMFHACKKLKTAPFLPATTLASKCYSNMFYECEALKVSEETISNSREDGIIFNFTDTAATEDDVDDMFLKINEGSDFIGDPTKGHSYKWYWE